MDYKTTLNLPKTAFPMKANLAQNEPRILDKWYAEDLYGRICESRREAPLYVLHDGPPYANGHIHMGTALNKILKDIVVKYKTMRGFKVPYLPGWDCHGLPIEHNVMKELGSSVKTMTNIEIRAECAAYAERFVAVMREEFKRLGGLGEWERPYLTMSKSYESAIVEEFQKILLSGRLYAGFKPVHWCISCKTALAEAEVEYDNHSSPSVWVKFHVESDLGPVIPELAGKKNVDVLIWTTTPWTLPANLGIAFHPTLDYVAFEDSGGVYIVADSLFRETVEICQFKFPRIVARFKGKILEGMVAKHPFYDRKSMMVLADYVTYETGTGCVHTAPGHGQEDYETGKRYGMEIYNPVDDAGNFVADLPLFGGMNVFTANAVVTQYMRNNGSLLAERKIEHSYPHCWRCKNPVVFRATRQWFISMDVENLRQEALKAIGSVQWIPGWGEERIRGMMENRPDWCISRQRVWGVPLTIFTCQKCGTVLKNPVVSSRTIAAIKAGGADAWFTEPDQTFLPPGITCSSCGHTSFNREKDIVDVWFESGVSHRAVLTSENGLRWPASLYLEGSDQHRGWFNSSLLTSICNHGRAPYETVLTHGFVVDGDGKKMSKSLGNVVAPEDIIQKYGADILRLWTASEDYTEDIRISDEILDRLTETYRRIRNTCRFMLGNLFDFDPDSNAVPFESMSSLDRYLLHRWYEVVTSVIQSYETFSFHNVVKSIHQFCILELSSLFLDISKDRFYVEGSQSPDRRSGQTATYIILSGMVRLIAPVLSFTAEELWSYIPKTSGSVHLQTFPEIDDHWHNEELASFWSDVLVLREKATMVLETARQSKQIGHSLDAKIVVQLPENILKKFEMLSDRAFADVLIVSQFSRQSTGQVEGTFDDGKIEVFPADGNKCERCWQYQPEVPMNQSEPKLCNRCANIINA